MTKPKGIERSVQIYPYLRLDVVEACIPWARALHVSDVALGPGGFVEAYRLAQGAPELLRVDAKTGQMWSVVRSKFLARALAQARRRGEALWRNDGTPTRRHLALLMWAYTPTPHELAAWVRL